MAKELEADVDVVESWEDYEKDPEALDIYLKKMSVTDEHLSQENTVPIILMDENNRNPMLMPHEPKVMILRRPSADAEVLSANRNPKIKNPVKTLQQREENYAQVRLRILGKSGAEQEIPESVVSESSYNHPPKLTHRLDILPRSIEKESTSTRNCSVTQAQLQSPHTKNVTIIRNPLNAGDRKGFTHKRPSDSVIS